MSERANETVVHVTQDGVWTMLPDDERPELRYVPAAELAAVRQQLAEAREEVAESDRIVERAWRDRDDETENAKRAEAALRETRQALLEGANVLAMIHQSTHAKSERSYCPVCDLISRMEALAAAGDATLTERGASPAGELDANQETARAGSCSGLEATPRSVSAAAEVPHAR